MSRWHSLFWSSNTSATERIQQFLSTHGYILYHPFGRYPGMAYPHTVKTFVAPAGAGWVRVLVEADAEVGETLAAYLSRDDTVLSAILDSTAAALHVYVDGAAVDCESGLRAYLRPGKVAELSSILRGEILNLPQLENSIQMGDMVLDDLPDNLQAMAQQVSTQQATGLFQRWSQQLLHAVNRQDVAASFEARPDWHSRGGQQIRAVMACLTIPQDTWRTPDYATLRSAYAAQSRRLYDPHAPLLPGDEQAMREVPNALEYAPVYGGKRME